MSRAQLRRLDRVVRIVGRLEIGPLIDQHHLESVALWAGVTRLEVVAEARRINALCREAGAWTQEARLAVVAADGMVPVEAMRAGIADLKRVLAKDAA